MKRFVMVVLACGVLPSALGQSKAVSAETQAHIEHVKAGLLPSVILKGDAKPAHSLEERMRERNVPGVSVAVIHHGEIEWAQGFGVTRVGGPAVTAETLFQAGSISKPVAAMAALRLVQQGKLSLDADINSELTSWKLPVEKVAAGKTVTLRELLTHSGGTTVHGFPGYAAGEAVPTLVQVLNGEKPANTPAIRVEAEPGTKWNYSGGGFTIMQQAVIDVAKVPFPKLLQETVLTPIGMKQSTYEQPLPEARRGEAATPYEGDGKAVAGGAHTYPEMAAAGLWTTPSDLARYAIEVQRSLKGEANHVLSQDMTKQMLTPGIGRWGLGIGIDGDAANPYFTHGGVNEGFESLLVAYENGGDGAIVMTNAQGGSEVAEEVMRSIAAEYGWPDWKPKIRAAVAVEPKTLESYAGTYSIDPQFDVVMTVEDGHLMMQAGSKFRLYAESESKFFLLDSDAEVAFMKDDQGRVTQLILKQGRRETKAMRK